MEQEFECVDENFEVGEVCDVVIRPEDFDRLDPAKAKLIGTVTDIVFKEYILKSVLILAGWSLLSTIMKLQR